MFQNALSFALSFLPAYFVIAILGVLAVAVICLVVEIVGKILDAIPIL